VKPLRVASIGCGDVAHRYAATLASSDTVELVGATDVDHARAADLAATFGGIAYRSLDELLADDRVDCVLNLTTVDAHAEVTARALESGKHVHSEKPLALSYDDANRLVDTAHRSALRLSCSPITYMGEAQQTAWRCIREGLLGQVRVIYAEVNHGRIETWHPRPMPFYTVGPLFDVAVYPLTLLTAFFGPVRRLTAYGQFLLPERVTLEGRKFRIQTPDFWAAVVELEHGPVARLTTSFYVGDHSKQKGIEFHGDDGSLFLESWFDFGAAVELEEYGGEYRRVPLVREGPNGCDYGRAVVELGEAIASDRPHRSSAEHAAHIVEVICAMQASAEREEPIEVTSSFPQPPPMDWAKTGELTLSDATGR
jgi:predicted dehydrogenase